MNCFIAIRPISGSILPHYITTGCDPWLFKLNSFRVFQKTQSKTMQAMAGFRNIAVHDYSSVNIEIIQNIIKNHLKDLVAFSKLMVEQI